MKCLKLQYKTLVIKIFSFLASIHIVFATDTKGSFYGDTNKHNLTGLFDSAKIYYDNGKYSNAILCLDRTLSVKKGLEKDIFPEYYRIYNRYGVVYLEMGFYNKAIFYFEKTLEFPLSQKNKARILMNIANVYTLKADFNSAITYFNKVLSLISDINDNDYIMLADTYYNIGKAYDNTSQNKLALNFFLLSKKIRENNGLPGDGETYLNCATNYHKLGKKDTANIYFNKAIKCFEKKYGKNHYSTALAYMNYASFLTDDRKYKEGLKLYNTSLKILANSVGSKHLYTSFCYKNLGELYNQFKDYNKALSYFQKSLIAKVYSFNDTSIYSNPSPKTFSNIDILEVLTEKALAFEKLAYKENEEKNLIAAFNTLELNVKLVEQLRDGYLYEGSKLKLSENEDDTYKALVRIAAKLYEKTGEQKYAEAAFRYSEKGKYGVLREFYNEEARMKAASVPDSLYDRLKNTREQLNSLRFQIGDENSLPKPDKEKLKSLREQLFDETQKYESLLGRIENGYPLYHRENNGVVSIKTFRSKLYSDQVAFEYTISDSALYTFFVSKDTFRLCKSVLDSNFFNSLSFYREFLSSQGYLSHDTFRISSYCLYQNLLQPFEKEIANKSLLIIPDGMFSLIPFGVLVDEPFLEGKDYFYPSEPYIIKKYPIGYAPSANLYLESFRKSYKRRNKILAVAPDFVFSDGSRIEVPWKHLFRLTAFNGKILNSEKATETNFKESVPNYNIVQIYAHGQENLEDPAKSWIMLEKDSLNDGLLYAYEVGSLKINAKLVVLASCYSGSGKVSDGEGVLSIGRSFLGTGTSAIIMALWYNYLEITSEQLWSMQKHLLLGKRKDKALQLAKLNYLEKANNISGHPKQWASLIMTGNQEPMYNLFSTMTLGISMLVLIFGTLFYFLFRKKKSK